MRSPDALPARCDATWIQTASGRQFWPLNPCPSEISIHDIAHALANKCRFTGHCRDFYSVAQHSVIVSNLCRDPIDMKWGLLHDAAEAYLPDIAAPIKPLIQGFDAIEEAVLRCVAHTFNLPWPYSAAVKHADLVALESERISLMARPPKPWAVTGTVKPTGPIAALSPADARRLFLDQWNEVMGAT